MDKEDDESMDIDKCENTKESENSSVDKPNNLMKAFAFKIEESNEISNVHETNRENPICEACCEIVKVPNKEDILYSYMYCKYCLSCVHVKCYGEDNQMYKCKAKDADIYDLMFICDKCEYTQKSKIASNQVKCILCLKGNGLMKRVNIEHSNTKTTEFCHVVCGFYCDEIEIRELSLVKFYRKQHGIKVYENENKCCFCNISDGFMLNCDRSTCKNCCHPYCMSEDRREATYNEDESVVSWEIAHTECVSSKSKAVPDRQGLGIIGYSNCEVVEESRKNKWKRGGYIVVYCDIHRAIKEFCKCNLKEDEENESFMIGCDYCDDWYHGECIGISSQEGNKYDSYCCEQCQLWETKRENLLYKICTTQTISMDIINNIKNYNKGILPEISKNFKFIDYLIIAQAWNKISMILMSSCREIPTIIDHLRVVEQIPVNCESKVGLLVGIIKQNLISAVELVKNFEQLKDMKVLEVIDDENKIIEENLEKNQNTLSKLKDSLVNIDQNKVNKCPGLLILQKNIECIETLDKIAKYYDKDNKESKTIGEYEELFNHLKSTTYQGRLLEIMDQEIADYEKFKDDAEYILSEDANKNIILEEEELSSDDDDSPIAMLEYKTKTWKYVVSEKIDKKNFIKTIKNGKELKCDVSEYLNRLDSIDIKCNEFELKLNKAVLCNSQKLDMNQVEKLIQEGIDLVIVPKSTILKAINLYRKLEGYRISTENILSSDVDRKVKYKDLENLINALEELSFNKHPISQSQLEELNFIYNTCRSIKKEVNEFESTSIRDLESLWRSVSKKTQVEIPCIEALHRKILILKLLFPDAKEDTIDSTIPEIEQALDDFVNKQFKVSNIDFDEACSKLKKRINYTIQVMKKRKKDDSAEEIQNDIMNLKQKGILLKSFDNEYYDSKRSHDWFKFVIGEIHRIYEKDAMKDINEKFDPLENFKQLQFLSLEQVNKFLGSISSINEILGVEPRKLLKSLNCIKWVFEYKIALEKSIDGKLSKEDSRRLVSIGKELKLKDDDIPEFSSLSESQKYLDLFDKFVNDDKCFDSLDKLLKMKTSGSLELLKETLPKVQDNPKKKAKLEEVIEHMKLSMLLGKAAKMLKNKNDLPEDLFGLKKILNKKNSDQEESNKNKSLSQSEEKTKAIIEYDKACELLDIADQRKLPEEAYWYKHLKEQLLELENWQQKYESYDDWKDRNKGKMHEQLKKSKDSYVIEKIHKDFLENAKRLIIPISEDTESLVNDVNTVKNWLSRAEIFLNQLTLRNLKVRTNFTEQESNELEKYFNELKELPMISAKEKETMIHIVIYYWLSKADNFICVMKKVKDNEDSDEEPKFNKRSYEEWSKLKKEIDLFTDESLLTKNGIYLTFIKHFNEATKIWEIAHKNKHNNLRSNPRQIEQLCSDAAKCKVDLSKEIDILKSGQQKQQEIRKNLLDSYKENMNIDQLMELYSKIKDFTYGFEDEQKKFKQIKRQYESLKKLFVSIMTKRITKSEKKMLISKAQYELKVYQNCNFAFNEGNEFVKFVASSSEKFKLLYKDVNEILNSKTGITWKQFLELKKRRKDLPFDFENEETKLRNNLSYLEKVAIIQTYKNFVKSQAKSPDQENMKKEGKQEISSILCKSLIGAKKEAEQIAILEKTPYTPQELLIPYSKILCYTIDLKKRKYEYEDNIKEKDEYKMDIDSDEQSTLECSKLLSKPLTNLEGLSDNDIINEIDKYKSSVQKEISSCTLYIQIKELESNLKLKSFIDFQDIIKPKKKELKKEYLKIKKEEHRIKREKEEEELKKSMDPEKYNELLRERKWQKMKRSHKTDCTIDNNEDDEEWDQRNLNYVDPDDKMDLDELSDSQPTKSKKDKSEKKQKTEKPKTQKEKVEKPKKEKVEKSKKEEAKPKAEKETKKKVTKDPKASKDKKREEKATKKEKEQEKEANEAKQKENKSKCNEALDRIKQRLQAKNEGDGKTDILKDLIKSKPETVTGKDLCLSVKEALAKARGEKLKVEPPREKSNPSKIESEPESEKEELDKESQNKNEETQKSEEEENEPPKKIKNDKQENLKKKLKTQKEKSMKEKFEINKSNEQEEKDESKKTNNKKQKEKKSKKQNENNDKLAKPKERKESKKKDKQKDSENQVENKIGKPENPEENETDKSIPKKEESKIKRKALQLKPNKIDIKRRKENEDEQDVSQSKLQQKDETEINNKKNDSQSNEENENKMGEDLPIIDGNESEQDKESKPDTNEDKIKEDQEQNEEHEKSQTKKSLFSRLSFSKKKTGLVANKFSLKKNTFKTDNKNDEKSQNNEGIDEEETNETAKENIKQNSQKDEKSVSDKEEKETLISKQNPINPPIIKKYTLKKNPGKPNGLAASLNKFK